MEDLIDSDHLFQQLLVGLDIPGAQIAADLDINAYDDVPFITHRSTIAQTGNAPGLWTAVLHISVFVEVNSATFGVVQDVYRGIHSWDDPEAGVIPGVGVVESVDRDIEAFTRLGQAVDMNPKSVTQYVGSFELTLRNHH